jgi:hypothetical protein
MNLNDLANLGQIIGAVAVVISLFYVASQIRQNTNAVRSATAQTDVVCLCVSVCRGLIVLSSVIGDGFRYIKRRSVAAHVIRAHFAFSDHARDGGFKARCALGFAEPVEHQLRC